jgi:hypothetical protein
MKMNATDLRLLLPDSIWLEAEQIEQAREISHQAVGEAHQWQAYLNSLGLLGFEQWINERLPDHSLHRETTAIEVAAQLQVGDFKLCLVTAEHVLDEVVAIPEAAINRPELISHFYVVLEVIEEQQEVIIRGFLRHDQLINHFRQAHFKSSNGHYLVPLSFVDSEPNHLLFYCRFLEPASIPPLLLSSAQAGSITGISNSIHLDLQKTRTKLDQWLEGIFEETWQTLDALINPTAALALSTRNAETDIRRGKLVDLGMQLARQTVALLIIVAPEIENKLSVLVQLHPTNEAKTLPPHLKLTLLSKLGKVLQDVESRQHDSYIQLKSFRGEPGKCFSIEISLEGTTIKEDFEL